MCEGAKRGRLLVIDGLDGSGKATQARLLAETLTARGLPVRQISFCRCLLPVRRMAPTPEKPSF